MEKVCKISYILNLGQYGVSKSDLSLLSETEQEVMWFAFNKYRKMLKIGDSVSVNLTANEKPIKISLLRFRKQTYYFAIVDDKITTSH